MNEFATIGGDDVLIILGASGEIGREAARLSVAYGADVISYTRSGTPPTDEPWTHGVRWEACDVAVDDRWTESVAGATAVVNAASMDEAITGRVRARCAESGIRLVEIGCATMTLAEDPPVGDLVHLRVPALDARAETGAVAPSAAGVAVAHAAMAALRAALEDDHQGIVEPEAVAYLGDAMFIQ